jgi:O-antigen ligase
MFTYAPFQVVREKTQISTNAGDRGNAHSEYLGPLADSGILGMLSFIVIVIMVLYKGITLYSKVKDERDKIWVMSLLLGLITYFVHGLLNNFLDTIKASALFWGFMAMLVAIEINYKQEEKKEEKILEKL